MTNDKTYITIPKVQYDTMEKNYKSLEDNYKSFKDVCSKDSKYIIISEKYNILKHLTYLMLDNPLLGCSKEDYIKTYEGTTYEEFLKSAMNSIEKTHGKMIQDMKDYKKEKENPVIKKGLFSKLFNK